MNLDANFPSGPELVIGLIGAVGCPLERVSELLRDAFSRVAYSVESIRLSSLLSVIPGYQIDTSNEGVRIRSGIAAGTRFREDSKLGDAVAMLGIASIRSLRGGDIPLQRKCFVVRSLKHPEELDLFREVYGEQFFALGIHTPRVERVDHLAQLIAQSRGGRAAQFRAEAEELITLDENERKKLGQSVAKIFPMADIFVTTTRDLASQIHRAIDLIFGRPVITPTKDESGMFHAHAAAMLSGAMGRQVGAAITTLDGDLVSVGCNEVPSFGGGHYWNGDERDGRDFVRGFDQSDFGKRTALRELLQHLKDAGWLNTTDNVDQAVSEVLRGSERAPDLTDTALLNLTEFTRDVHGECAALLAAARLGVSVRGCTLYVTTFPCHNCAKHIVAAGIHRVVFVQPYAKSYAEEFYADSIVVDPPSDAGRRVSFEAFSGIAAGKFMEWFAMGTRKGRTRKGEDGKIRSWDPHNALPIFVRRGFDLVYPQREEYELKKLEVEMKRLGIYREAPIDSSEEIAND